MKSRDADPVDVHVGAQIRLRRREMKISQGDLGASCGVTFQQVQKYENGQNRISASALYQVAAALHCEPGDLFPPRDDQEPAESSTISRALGLVPEVLLIPELPAGARRVLGLMITALRGVTDKEEG